MVIELLSLPLLYSPSFFKHPNKALKLQIDSLSLCLELDIKYFDLGLPNCDAINNRVIIKNALATLKGVYYLLPIGFLLITMFLLVYYTRSQWLSNSDITLHIFFL